MISRFDINVIEIDLINHCNLSCSVCARQQDLGKSLKKGKYLEIDIILSLLKFFPKLEVVDLVGSYSEPTFYPQFIELVSRLKQNGYRLRIGTNGNTRDKKFWENLGIVLTGNDIVRFGIDGSTQDLHARYREGGSLDTVLKNHRALKDKSKTVTVLQNIIFEHNYNDLDGIKKIFTREGFNFLELTHTGKPYSPIEKSNVLPVEELLDRHVKLEKILKEIKIAKFDCQAVVHKQLYLSHLGILLPCDDLEEFVLKEYVEGEVVVNVLDNTIEECLDFANALVRRRGISKECHRACCDQAQAIKSDYPVLQCGRDLNFEVLHSYREVLSAKR